MKSVRTKEGSAKTRPFYKDYEIERMCIDELHALGYLPTNPEAIRIDRFIEKRFGLTPGYLDLPAGMLGFTKFGAFGPETMVISRSPEDAGKKVSQRRVRPTLAHEAGHALLHASLFDDPKRQMKNLFDQEHEDMSKVLCRDVVGSVEGQRQAYHGAWWELQANMAMGSLLLPETLFRRAAAPFLGIDLLDSEPVALTGEGKRALELALSNIFDVNPVVVHYRLHQLYPSTR